jgi:hypothetical protein
LGLGLGLGLRSKAPSGTSCVKSLVVSDWKLALPSSNPHTSPPHHHRRNYDAYIYVKYVNGGRAPRGVFEVFGGWVESAFDSVMSALGFASGGGGGEGGGPGGGSDEGGTPDEGGASVEGGAQAEV